MYRALTHRWIPILIVTTSMALTSCHRKIPVNAAPPAPAAVVLPKPEPKPKPPATLPQAPKIESAAPPPATNPPVLVEVNPPAPKPEPTKKKSKRAVSKKAGSKTETKAIEAAQAKSEPGAPDAPAAQPGNVPSLAPPVNPGPKLGQMLSTNEMREYQKRLDSALERSRGAVLIIQGKTLSAEQKETVDRIRSFVAQAEQVREQDMVGAVNLAERADIISKDLLDRLK